MQGDAVVARDVLNGWAERRVAKREGRQARPQGSPQDIAGLLEQLVWEQQQTNKMLWASLSDEQRATYRAL